MVVAIEEALGAQSSNTDAATPSFADVAAQELLQQARLCLIIAVTPLCV
jgi:hypothetical protein